MPDNKTFLETARKRFQLAAEEERQIREEAKEDLRFRAGDQWDPRSRKEREEAARPALTFNRLPTFIAQIANEARQNKPQIRFSPAEDGDEDTAEVYEGLARHIQYASKADVCYETALDYSTSGSFAYIRLLTDYVDDKSFDQEVRFAAVMDPFAVYGIMVPKCRGQKPRWAFVVEDLSREEFERQYPDSDMVSLGFDAVDVGDWVTKENVRIAEYWYTESKTRKLQSLSNGQVVYSDEYKDLPEGVTVENEREVTQDTIKFCKMNGLEVLKGTETEWAGDCIPIFAVLGPHLVIDNRPQIFSITRFLRDPQRMLNFYKSGIAEQIGLSNRAPYVGWKGQFKDPRWANANRVNYAYLEVEPVSINGKELPLPQRQQFEAPIQALSVAAAQEVDELKSIAGIYDASLGAEGNETSGIAIRQRQAQTGLTNYAFIDNLTRAQAEAGDALAYLIPRVYDTPRMIRILGEDEQQRVVHVNAPAVDPQTGKPTRYILTAGKYDVTVSSGPSYTTKRQETAAMTENVLKAAPQLLGVIGDIYFRNSDMAGADETAERVKKWIGMQLPGLIEDDKQKATPIPPQVQAQMQALMQQHEQLTQVVHAQADEINTRKAETDSRERIAAMQEETKRTIALAQLQSQEGLELLRQEIASVKHQLDMQHQAGMKASDQEHQANMTQMQQQHDMGMAQQSQDFQAQQSAQDQEFQAQQAKETNNVSE